MNPLLARFIQLMTDDEYRTEYDIEREGKKKHCIRTHGSSIWFHFIIDKAKSLAEDDSVTLIRTENTAYVESYKASDDSFDFEWVEGDCILAYEVK